MVGVSNVLPVFNVTDHDGKKVTDEAILEYIRKVSLLCCY